MTDSNMIKKSPTLVVGKSAMVEAMTKSLGIVTKACQAIGISRTTYYEWYNRDPEFKAQIDELDNVVLDFAESKLHEQINDNNTSATIFYLKTKGRKRGYIENPAISINTEGNTQINLLLKSDDAKHLLENE